jgi:Fe-S-cluster containining protein
MSLYWLVMGHPSGDKCKRISSWFNWNDFVSETKPRVKEEYENENENDELTELEGYVKDYDWPDDCTYAYWVYEIPERSRDD